MYKVIVTGGIGSGKSAVADLLREHGAHVISLDRIGHEVLSDPSVISKIADAFGSAVLDGDGQVDRARLAQAAFCDDASTELLNSITHPAIMERTMDRINLAETSCIPFTDADVLVIEVPLLTSGAGDAGGGDPIATLIDIADEVVAVTAPWEVRTQRLLARGLEAGDIAARMRRQPPEEDYVAAADTVICNAGGIDELEDKVDAWWRCREGSAWQRRADKTSGQDPADKDDRCIPEEAVGPKASPEEDGAQVPDDTAGVQDPDGGRAR